MPDSSFEQDPLGADQEHESVAGAEPSQQFLLGREGSKALGCLHQATLAAFSHPCSALGYKLFR